MISDGRLEPEDAPHVCPGCGKRERECPQFGDECWRNNGCPASPPDRTPEPDRGHCDAGLDDDAPHVCPGCYAVGGERCAPGCVDAEMAERDRCEHEERYADFFERDDGDDWEWAP